MTKTQLFHAVLFGLSLAGGVALYALGQSTAAAGLLVFATGLGMRSPFTPSGGADA
jgi:hypothetical protein